MIKLPFIYTKRLLLRPLRKQDAKSIYAYAKREDVGPSAGWVPHTSIQDTYEFIDYALHKRKLNQPGVWVIIEQTTDRLIGTIEIHSYQGYKAEIGFVLHPNCWNQGYITEASLAVMVYAFEELKLSRLAYHHFLDNYASRRVREKLGFHIEGIKRKGFKHGDGTILDEVVASFTKDDYKAKKALFDEVKASIKILN
ncbi:MAG: GNAT family N-acetyltransferase [Candidatus Izemoplasmataceae bacterium]